MKTSTRTLAVVGLMMLFVVGAAAQLDKKPYTEWSEKDAQKILSNSGWAQTQTVTDTTQAYQASAANASGQSRSNDIVNVNFRVRLFSSKPVREAFSRLIELQMKDRMTEPVRAQLKGLVEAEFGEHIVITVFPESSQATKKLNEAMAVLQRTQLAEFKNNTYISVKGQERLYLIDYQPPGKDGFGAKFIFPRNVNGEPYITPGGSEIFFRTELGGVVDISVRFKVKDMMYNGKLEY